MINRYISAQIPFTILHYIAQMAKKVLALLKIFAIIANLNEMAGLHSGHASDCKSADAGSIPASASIFILRYYYFFIMGVLLL